MKKLYLIFILYFFSLSILAQDKNEPMESVLLITDRTVYAAGESIHFSSKVFYQGREHAKASRILYLELITPGTEQIIGYKFALKDQECKGSIVIPEGMVSGNYYLRAYTKLMRNSCLNHISYCYLKIVNPHKNELNDIASLPADSFDAFFTDTIPPENYFDISLEADKFENREKVNVHIEGKAIGQDSILYTIISVVPLHSVSDKSLKFNEVEAGANNDNRFTAESLGITISGRVEHKADEKCNLYDNISLSIFGENRNLFYPILSDSEGRFNFTFPELFGNYDLFISYADECPDSEIFIDNDFYSRNIALPSPSFTFSVEERLSTYKISVNEQLSTYFNGDLNDVGEKHVSGRDNDTIPFYGRPDQVIYIDDFIELPTIPDYFYELAMPVKIRKLDGVEKIVINGTNLEMLIHAPLIMVDFIRVYNLDEITKINPEKVSRFEVVTSPYVRGEVIFGGILNIISRENDFASIKLPESGQFLNYRFLSQTKDLFVLQDSHSENIPDTRNTLFWNPHLELNKESSADISFLTADTDETYIIKVVGITQKGNKVSTVRKFEVK